MEEITIIIGTGIIIITGIILSGRKPVPVKIKTREQKRKK